jgi:cytochrome P450
MLPPGPRTPAIYNTLTWILSPAKMLERLLPLYGDIFTLESAIFGTEVIVTRPDLLKQVFTGDPDVFHAGESNQPFEPFVGATSLLLLDGREHLATRRMMLPPFHGERMRSYTKGMYEVSARAFDAWGPGQRIGLHAAMQRITLEIILRTVMGLEEGPDFVALRDTMTSTLEIILSPFGAIWLMPAFRRDLGRLTPWASIKRGLDTTDAMLTAHIRARRAAAARGETRDDVLSMLLEARDEQGEPMSDEMIRDQLATLLAAGHETSATTIAWIFEELLRCPGEQDRLIDEATSVIGSGPVEPEAVARLERLDSVVKEALRPHPATAAVARRLKKPIVLDGYEIPAGVMVVPCMHLTHRRPELYPDPDRFVPDRFIGKKVDPYEWAPFGGGTRRCVGMAFAMHEVKVLLATLFSRGVRLSLDQKGPYRTILRSFLYAPKGGTQVTVEARAVGPREARPAPVTAATADA